MSIYTKKGDKGQSEIRGRFLDKDHPLFSVLGTLDELSCWLGLVKTEVESHDLVELLTVKQKELFLLGLMISGYRKKFPTGALKHMEKEISLWEAKLPPLSKFLLSGGTKSATLINLSRAVCRRLEREIVSCDKKEKINHQILIYFNRFSDWLFVLARMINFEAGKEEEKIRL